MWLSLTQFLDYNEKVSGIDNHWCFSTSPFIISHKSKFDFSEVWKAMCSLSLRMSGILSNFHLPDSQEIENRPSSYTCCRCLRPWWPAAMLQPRRPHWSTEWPKQARLENLLRSQGPWSKSCCGNIRERDHHNRSIMSWGECTLLDQIHIYSKWGWGIGLGWSVEKSTAHQLFSNRFNNRRS